MKDNLLYIPFDYYNNIGGPSSFMKNLKMYLDKNGIIYSDNLRNAGCIFFPISFNKSQLKQLKNRDGKIIQRLDGIYYPTKHDNKYIELNNNIKDIYCNFSNHIIFQSSYSKRQCFAMFGEKKEENYSIVINGVNKQFFYPAKSLKDNKDEIVFITTGSFRNIDMIEPIIKALDILNGQVKFKLKIVGPILNPEISSLFNTKYVEYLGKKTLEDVAVILRDADIFLYSYLNPPCPNSVLEAISCGLPVVGFDSGAMSELLFFSKELLAPVSDDLFQRYEDFDYNKLSDKILLCIDNFGYYKQRAMDNHHLFRFEECGKQYMQIFQQFTNIENPDKSNLLSTAPQKKYIMGKVIKHLQNDKLHAIFKKILLEKPAQPLSGFIENLIRDKTSSLSPFEALQFLFDIENRLYNLEGQASVRYGNGIHTKHMHIKYHDFFIEHIPDRSRVIDIGCGNGALTHDIASKVPDTMVYGIDLVQRNIETAKDIFSRDNITYAHGDALKNLPDADFDIIVLSNVLEHIEKRVEFLKKLNSTFHPVKILIRVPLFERDWRVPLKQELGVDYRLDSTHFVEYKTEEFFNELKQSGLFITHYQINWGEIWAEAVPNDTT